MHIIGGTYRNRTLMCPKGQEVRPTSGQLRESLFNICQTYIEGASFLDIFAGSGAMGLEALSRGAKASTFIELSKEAIKCIEKNIEQLDVETQTRLLKGNALYLVEKLAAEGQQFDIVFADPPYSPAKSERHPSLAVQILEKIDQLPLLLPGGSFFLEDAKTDVEKPSKLTTLTLKKTRPMGRSVLYQYIKA